MESQDRKFVNFTGFCVALLAIWITLNGLAQAATGSGQVVSIKKADGTSNVHPLGENSSVAFAIKDGKQVPGSLSIIVCLQQK